MAESPLTIDQNTLVVAELDGAGATLPEGAVRRGTSAELYRQAVEAAKEYIRAGDAFQVVLSQRFDFDLGCDPFDVYRVLRQVNPSP